MVGLFSKPTEATAQGETSQRDQVSGLEEFFPSTSASGIIPFPTFFENHIKGQWNRSVTSKTTTSSLFHKLYPLSKTAVDLLQVPPVDAEVTAIQTSGVVSQDGHGSIRDSWDCKADTTAQ